MNITTLNAYLCSLSGVLGQISVHQDGSHVISELETVQFKCFYNGTEYSVQWYQMFSDRHIQPILLLSTNGNKSQGRFTMFLDTKAKFTSLSLSTAQMEDSAVYYCAVEALWHTRTVTENKNHINSYNFLYIMQVMSDWGFQVSVLLSHK